MSHTKEELEAMGLEDPEAVSIDLGELQVPVPQKTEEPWIFRGACCLKEPWVDGGVLAFGLILDLGFGVYQQINAMLDGVDIDDGYEELAVLFAASWAENGQPNDLVVKTLDKLAGPWAVEIYRTELEIGTLKDIGVSSLATALTEQGFAT